MWRCTLALLLCCGVASGKPHARITHPGQGPRAHATPRERYPSIPIFGAHVGESLIYRPFDAQGRARRDAGRALERLLRNRQTGARHRLHPRLGAALYQIGRHFAGHRIEIFSGFRPRAYCNRAHSRHMTGSAVDFRVEGVRNEELIAYLKKTFHPAGVGAYPHGVHVHLDLERTEDTYWVDAGPPPGDPTIALPEVVDSLGTAPDGAAAEVAEASEDVDVPSVPQALPPPPDGDPDLPDPPME